jgi:hypothetical protein
MVAPPADFDPEQASDQEVSAYGLAPRPPAGSPNRAHWDQTWGQRHKAHTFAPCLSSVSAAWNNDGWAGGANEGSTGAFYISEGEFNQTGWDSTCPIAQSLYATWVGLGGWHSLRLLQDGTEALSSGVDDIVPWWEAIMPNPSDPTNPSVAYDTREVYMDDPGSIRPGDAIEAITYYMPNATGGPAVQFTILDVTTGMFWDTFPLQSIPIVSHGSPATSNFYDGTHSEFITERPKVNNVNVPLRKPFLNTTYWSGAWTNFTGISSFSGFQIAEPAAPAPTVDTSNWDGRDAWSNTWERCS